MVGVRRIYKNDKNISQLPLKKKTGFIKDDRAVRMSAGQKRARVESEREDFAVISSMGSIRPVEIIPDSVTTFWLRKSASTSSYVCVPGVGAGVICLADYTNTQNRQNIRYTKKMIPSTAHLRDLHSRVIFLFCHGGQRRAETLDDGEERRIPSYVALHERERVDVAGNGVDISPDCARIYACASCVDEVTNKTHTKPEGAVTLSEVVKNAKLVMLLCCFGRNIITDYGNERPELVKPDVLLYLKESVVYDTSTNIFITLLMHAIDNCEKKTLPWEEIVKRNICQVMLWVKEHGEYDGEVLGPDRFWNFLLDKKFVEEHIPYHKWAFRIKNLPFVYPRSDDKTEDQDKQELLDDLRSLNLLLWHNVPVVGSHVPTGYYEWISYKHDAGLLEKWIKGDPFRDPDKVRMPEDPRTHNDLRRKQAHIDLLLLQMKGLMVGA